MAEELVIGLEGLIVFQGAESLQVRNALRAAKRPMRNGHIHSSTHTCKGHRKDMDGRMRKVPQWGSHTYALTCHRVAVCSCLLWENAGGLSLEAGTGSHPQQPPISLINQPKLRGQAAALRHRQQQLAAQISFGLGKAGHTVPEKQTKEYAQG